MNFDLTAHTARQNRKTAADTIKEACRLIAGCTDPQRRFAFQKLPRHLPQDSEPCPLCPSHNLSVETCLNHSVTIGLVHGNLLRPY